MQRINMLHQALPPTCYGGAGGGRGVVLHLEACTIAHTEENNLFFALRGAGSSYAVVTEFLYVVHHTPETLPAILLAWADNQDDLDAIQASFCELVSMIR